MFQARLLSVLEAEVAARLVESVTVLAETADVVVAAREEAAKAEVEEMVAVAVEEAMVDGKEAEVVEDARAVTVVGVAAEVEGTRTEVLVEMLERAAAEEAVSKLTYISILCHSLLNNI